MTVQKFPFYNVTTKIRKFQLSDFLFASQIYHHIKGEKKNADRRNNSNRTPNAPRNDA